MTPEEHRTLLITQRRLDALGGAIAARAPWHEIEFMFDQLASKVAQLAGTRGRDYDNGKDQPR